jgi:hypothetical protein
MFFACVDIFAAILGGIRAASKKVTEALYEYLLEDTVCPTLPSLPPTLPPTLLSPSFSFFFLPLFFSSAVRLPKSGPL